VFPEKTTEFRIEVDLVAEMSVINPFDFFLEPAGRSRFPSPTTRAGASSWRRIWPKAAGAALPKFLAYVASMPREPKASVDFLVALNQRCSRTSAT
jgi:hypothetical protein